MIADQVLGQRQGQNKDQEQDIEKSNNRLDAAWSGALKNSITFGIYSYHDSFLR